MCIVLAPVAAAGDGITASTVAATTAVTAALSIAATVATTMAQASAASKQKAALSKAAQQSFNNKQQQEQTALIQKQIATQTEEMNSNVDAAKARATARTSAGEA